MNYTRIKPFIFISAIVLLVLMISSNINWGGDRSKNIIRSDGKCYNLYLPAIFIYNDLSFKFVEDIEFKTYHDENNCLDCRQYYADKIFDKYTAGVAVAQMPFFLVAHAYAWISGIPADGYSTPYQISVSVAALFYLLVGLLFLNYMLATYQISFSNRMLVLLCCVFGTNLLYYTIGEPGLSHIYSFAFINMLVYYVRQYFRKAESIYLIWSGMVLGMILLIRPINIIILPAMFLLADDKENFLQRISALKHKIPVLLIAFFCVVLLLGIQSGIYFIQTGKLWIYSYGNETFYFGRPEMWNILFSYKKGLFLYTPMYLISLAGLIIMFRKQKWTVIFTLLFLLFFTYVVSCWWNWWYGGSFSSRVYVDILVFFMLPLAYLLQAARKKLHKILLIFALFLIVALCQIQTYQYRYYIIHWENMTKEKYWDNFLKL